MDLGSALLLLPTGLAVGILGGFFGLGGGVLLIPALTLAIGSQPQLYQTTSFVVGACVAAASLPRHRRAKAIVKPVVWRTIIASLPAGILLSLASNSVSSRAFEVAFACFLVYVAGYEIVSFRRASHHADNEHAPTPPLAWRCPAIGVAIGSLSGLLGIGGGTVAVPLFRIALKLPIRQAVGTSAATILPTLLLAGATKLASVANGAVADGGAPVTLSAVATMSLMLAPTAILGAQLGTHLLHRVSPRKAALGFGLLLLVLAARMLGLFG